MMTVPVQNPKWLRHGFAEFERIILAAQKPIVLLEGSRDVSLEIQQRMEQLASAWMRRFPDLIARSGNAEGSDQAWARGVNAVDPRRLQLILPVPNYRADAIQATNESVALREVAPHDFYSAKALTREHYAYGSRTGPVVYDALPDFKRRYLDRDALKVLGCTDYSGKRMKATAALFHINPAKRNGGGTGHTLRLCEAERVPYFLSKDWLSWLV